MKHILAAFLLQLFCISVSAQLPAITSFAPLKGRVNDTISISGTNFSTTPSNNIVRIGRIQAQVISASASQLSVKVPLGSVSEKIHITVNGLTAISTLDFLQTHNRCSDTLWATSFSGPSGFASGTNPQNIKAADIDGDGKSDLILGNMSSNNISILRNTSTSGVINAGSFAAKVDIASGVSTRLISIADFDGDGKLDIAAPSYNGNQVCVHRNTSTPGNISFSPKADFSLPGSGFNSCIADFNQDGKPDLVATSIFANKITVFPNSSTIGTISFGASFDFTTGSTVTAVEAADLNLDGKPEIVVCNQVSNTISIFRNVYTTGVLNAASFAAQFDVTISSPVGIKLADFDGDGKNDIGVTNGGGPYYFSVIRNLYTSGTFNASSWAAKVDVATNDNPQFLSTGDLNGDGKLDIVTPNSQSNSLSIIRNKSLPGALSFAPHVTLSTGLLPTGSEIVDIDNDELPDIAICSQNSSQATVYRNVLPVKPAVNIGADTTYCSSFTRTLNAANPGASFFWSTNATTSAINIATPGLYWVKVTNANRCETIDSILVNQVLISANAGTDKTITAGDSVMLNGTGTASAQYRWFPSTTLSDTVGLTPFAKPPITTSYVLRVSQGNCVAYDTVVVYVTSATCNDCSAAYQVNDSLVACYLFNGDAQDNSGYNNHGTVYGATLTTDRFGAANSAYAFDGVNDYIEVPNSTSLTSPLNNLSVAFWVQVNAWNVQFGVNYASVLSKSNSTTNCQYRVSLKNNGISVINNGKLWDFNGPTIVLGNWVHVAVVFNNSSVNYYINGVYAGQSTAPSVFGNSSSNSMYIGRDDPGTIDYFNGKIDDVKIFSKALSAAAVQSLYSRSFVDFAQAGADTTACPDDSVRLTPMGGQSYAWYPQQGLSDTTQISPYVKPDQTRSYVLSAKRFNCVDLDTVLVTYLPVHVNAGSDTAVCIGKSVTLQATGSGTIGWRSSTTLSDTTTQQPIATPTTTTTYMAKAVNGRCIKTDSIKVTVHVPAAFDAGSTAIICSGDSVQLNATTGLLNYAWQPAAVLTNAGIANPMAFPVTSTLFTATAQDLNGCELQDTVTVLVTSGLFAQLFNNDTVVCAGDTVKLYAHGGLVYTWESALGLSSTTIHNPIAVPINTTRYRVEVSNGGNCKGKDSVLVTVRTATQVTIKDTAFCQGGVATISAEPVIAGSYRYQWNTGDTLKTIQVRPSNTTDYVVRLSDNGCFSAWDTAKVTVHPLPVAGFTALPAQGFVPHQVSLNNQSTGAVNYYWNFGDASGITGRAFDTTYEYQETGTFRVRLIAENQFGCLDSVWKLIRVSDSVMFYIPNVFTPNEDGTNDVWEVILSGITDYRLMIYNRWGEKLFEQSSSSGTKTIRWDGTYNSRAVPDGVYFFILNYVAKGVGRNERAGPIHIIR